MGFESAFIVGFGQMGKSVANTLRINNFGGKIMVSSRSKVENCDFIDGNFDCNDAKNDYNNSVIFVCTPPRTVPEIVVKMLEMTKKYENCVVSDICSIKQEVAKIHGKNFISIHQMDGGNSDTARKHFFKKRILNYIITDNFANVDVNMLTRYNDFLHDFLNCENVEVSAKIHDETVAFTSHLQNLILASYCNDFSKIDNQMWREIFIQNQKNIEYFLNIFLEKVQKKNDNNSLADAIILADKTIIIEQKIDIKKELFNPSLRMVFELKNGAMNYQNFVKNMQIFFENLVSKKKIKL